MAYQGRMPALPRYGTGVLRLYDTARGAVHELEPRRPGRLSMYVCGPTVYDEPHVGHGRFALVWDILRRYLEWTGVEVDHVSNVTDIDDRIIARANEEGRPAAEVARHYEEAWWRAMDALGVLRPTDDPHATAYVARMIDLIAELVASGTAYPGRDGVYFAAESVADYGLLAHQPIASLKAGARVEVDEGQGKRSPVDFVLWKAAKPGEPWWESPWGPGRPGWHTECVVMSLDLLGEDFDLHGGGIDLAFPHHENERAQAVAAGRRFSRRWAHSGHVVVEGGEKMSKSLGNFLLLSDLLDQYDARAYRLLVLQSHYRSPLTVADTTMAAAAQAVERLDAFARRLADTAVGAQPDPPALERFRAAMDDDLDTPRAVAQLFELVTLANGLADRGDHEGAAPLAAAVLEMASAVGLPLHASSVPVDEAASLLAAERNEARRRKDYARADALRAELQAQGWIVEDTPGGTLIRR
jgi:cysteinyl-tRNA synthetase